MEAKDTYLDERQTVYNKGFKAGIREVVEWLKKHNTVIQTREKLTPYYIYPIEEWQAKLKEWEVK